jgi:hypothetical protein
VQSWQLMAATSLSRQPQSPNNRHLQPESDVTWSCRRIVYNIRYTVRSRLFSYIKRMTLLRRRLRDGAPSICLDFVRACANPADLRRATVMVVWGNRLRSLPIDAGCYFTISGDHDARLDKARWNELNQGYPLHDDDAAPLNITVANI